MLCFSACKTIRSAAELTFLPQKKRKNKSLTDDMWEKTPYPVDPRKDHLWKWWTWWRASTADLEKIKVAYALYYTATAIPFTIYTPFLGIARPQPQFSHSCVFLSDLYIPRISLHISSSRTGRPIVGIYNSLTDTWMWKLGLRPQYSFSGNICFKFSAFSLCSVTNMEELRPNPK